MQWLSLFLSALSWWTWWGQSMAHGSTDLQRKRGVRWEKWMQIFQLWSNKSTRNITLYWAIILIHNKGGLMVCVQCHWNVWFPQYGKSELSLWVCVCVCVHKCGTHSLKGLEDAVEEKVPDHFAVLKGRNVPYEEIRKHSQRGREQDPSERDEKRRQQQQQQHQWMNTWVPSSVKHSHIH